MLTKYVFTDEELLAVRSNLFHRAHSSVGPWEDFQWHTGRNGRCDAHVPHSSQALAIDYFGTLHAVDQLTRDAVLGKIAESLGLPTAGPWEIKLEWRDSDNLLRELTQTQVDAAAESPNALILFEAKFTESDGGSCSQTRPDKNGVVQCNGSYSLQTNPKNKVSDACALSG